MRPPRRPCRLHFPDEGIGLFKCINEAESHIRVGFVRVIIDRKVDILLRFGARYDRFCSHDPARCVTRSRRPWKYPASTGALRSEERLVGNECVTTCSSRWSPSHSKKTHNK